MSDVSSSPGIQSQNVVSMEDHLMTVPNVDQLDASPTFSTTELGLLGGARRDPRFSSSRGASTSSPRDSPVWGVPESSPRIAQARDQDPSNAEAPVQVPLSSPTGSSLEPAIMEMSSAEASRLSSRTSEDRTSVLNIIVKPRDRDSSHRNGLAHRPRGS